MIDDANCTPNYRWNLAHTVRQAVPTMDEYQKQQALLRIQSEPLKDNTPDPNILEYVTTLLNGKKPRKGISKRK